jgi:serine/threonine protein phosphatase PrpC
MRATLWGADHVELDRIASASAGEHAAVAITRGRFAKLYSYEDPNEDAVAVVAGPRSTLLICADGHYGVTSSHVAVQAVLDALGDDPPPALDDDGWAGVFGAANDAIVAAKEGEGRHPASDTVLMAALVTPGQLSFASIGDAALVVCRPGEERGRQLNREAMRFLGRPMTRRGVRNTVQRQTLALEPDQWVVAVTDGLSEFIAPLRPADVVPRVLADGRSGSVEAAAVAVVEAACAAGAGDNVAVALVAPAPEG